MKTEDITEIGVVTLEYSPDGQVVLADFTPSLKYTLTPEELSQLRTNNPGNLDLIRENSDIVMASWFNKVTEIEIADREEYTLKSEVIDCLKYSDDNVKKCKIKYIFTKN